MRLLVFVLLLVPSFAWSQTNFSTVTNAIGKGDMNVISQYLDANVEVALLSNEDVYEKAKAIRMLTLFFDQNKPKSFKEVHKGASRGNDSQYCIGNLTTSKKTFRVYIYMKSQNGNISIKELRFDEE